MQKEETNKKALIMVDLQNDFCSGGHLAVNEGDEIIPLANQIQNQFELIIATKDWHPKNHCSFVSNHAGHQVGDVVDANGIPQTLWPDHCIQNSAGSEFHPNLDTHKINKIFYKGSDANIDSYSGFFDNAHLRSTGLDDYLRELKIDTIYILGLATDYCIKFTALDAVHLKYNVNVIQNACRGVELNKGDVAKAFEEMQKAGVKIV